MQLQVVRASPRTYFLRFRYHPDLVSYIKRNFSFRRFDPSTREWQVKLRTSNDFENFLQLLKAYEKDSEAIKTIEAEYQEFQRAIELSYAAAPPDYVRDVVERIPIPEGLSLWPFQKAAVAYLELVAKGKGILGQEMGLGKTVIALSYLNLHPELRPVIIFCPSTLRFNWQREIEKWILERKRVWIAFSGKEPPPANYDFYILSYTLARKFVEELQSLEAPAVIIDEAHYIKNHKAQRTKAVVKVAKGRKAIIAITGTPILNKPVEVFNVLNLLAPSEFTSWKNFVFRYAGAHYERIGRRQILVVNGATHLDELGEILRSRFMTRQKKEDVLKDLPEKLRTLVELDVEDVAFKERDRKLKAFIEKINRKREILEWLRRQKKKKDANVDEERLKKAERIRDYLAQQYRTFYFREIELYRQITGLLKVPAVVEFVVSTVEQGEKVVVFAHHRNVVKELEKALKEKGISFVTLTGETSPQNRQMAIDKFQNDEGTKVFIGTIGAASEGITLTAASIVVFLEYDWTPAKMKQAEDRLHRITQKDTVNSYWFTIKDSIDYMFMGKLMEKTKIVEKLMDYRRAHESILKDILFEDILSK